MDIEITNEPIPAPLASGKAGAHCAVRIHVMNSDGTEAEVRETPDMVWFENQRRMRDEASAYQDHGRKE